MAALHISKFEHFFIFSAHFFSLKLKEEVAHDNPLRFASVTYEAKAETLTPSHAHAHCSISSFLTKH